MWAHLTESWYSVRIVKANLWWRIGARSTDPKLMQNFPTINLAKWMDHLVLWPSYCHFCSYTSHRLQLDARSDFTAHRKNINAIRCSSNDRRYCSMIFNDIQRYSMIFNDILPHGLIRLASPIEPVSASKLWTMISVLSWNVWSQYNWHRPACVHHYPVFTERCFRQFEVQTLNSNASAPIRFGQWSFRYAILLNFWSLESQV